MHTLRSRCCTFTALLLTVDLSCDGPPGEVQVHVGMSVCEREPWPYRPRPVTLISLPPRPQCFECVGQVTHGALAAACVLGAPCHLCAWQHKFLQRRHRWTGAELAWSWMQLSSGGCSCVSVAARWQGKPVQGVSGGVLVATRTSVLVLLRAPVQCNLPAGSCCCLQRCSALVRS